MTQVQQQEPEYPVASEGLNVPTQSCPNFGRDTSLYQSNTMIRTNPLETTFQFEEWNASPNPIVESSAEVAEGPLACGKPKELLARLFSTSQRSLQQQQEQQPLYEPQQQPAFQTQGAMMQCELVTGNRL
jgi:hypothetical protein